MTLASIGHAVVQVPAFIVLTGVISLPVLFLSWRMMKRAGLVSRTNLLLRVGAIAGVMGLAGGVSFGMSVAMHTDGLVVLGLGGALSMALSFMAMCALDLRRADRAREAEDASSTHMRWMYLAPLIVFGTAFGAIPPMISGPGPAAREAAVVAAMKTYEAAQHMYIRGNPHDLDPARFATPPQGTFRDLFQRGYPRAPEGEVLGLINERIADAWAGATDTRPYHGYLFEDIVFDDPTHACGLCAAPAPGQTGQTFIFSIADGAIYRRDTGGVAVTRWPDVVADRWLLVGE